MTEGEIDMLCNICKRKMKIYAKGVKWTYWHCNRCDFYGTSINNGKTDEFDYDEYETFDAELSLRKKHIEDAARILNYKFSIVGGVPNTFLDIGCSEGLFVEAFNRITNSQNGCGIEVSRPKIERAKKKGLNVGSFEEIKGKFDFILLRQVIEHIDTPKEYLENIIQDYLAENGVICVETPNNNCITDILTGRKIRDDRFCRDLYPPTHVCGFTPKTWKKWSGLNVVYMTTSSWQDINWFYNDEEDKQNTSWKDKIRDRMMLNGNLIVFVAK